MPHIFAIRFLIPTAVALAIGASVAMTTLMPKPAASIWIDPPHSTTVVGNTFSIDINVKSSIPVNAFRGNFSFDESKLEIIAIDYNTSIADLWVTEPWYSNGSGTFTFAGGTTKPGGFSGDGTLLTITFETIAVGEAPVEVDELQILQHDGLGTDVTDLENSIDALFTIPQEDLQEKVVTKLPTSQIKQVTVAPVGNTLDFNNDNTVSIIDVSIFMQKLASGDTRADFNGDGKINTKDLSIILQEL